jgi:uncharacterized protein YkwD
MYCSNCGYKFEKFDDNICRLCGSTSKSRSVSTSRPRKPKKSGKKFSLIIIPILAIVIIFGVFNFNLLDQKYINSSVEDTHQVIQDVMVPVIDITIKSTEKLNEIIKDTTEIKNSIIQKPSYDSSVIEKLVHKYTNDERKKLGLHQLTDDKTLAKIARGHSADMSLNNYFEHVNLKGMEPTDRANKVGYSCVKNYGSYYTEGIAENIFQHNLYNSINYINGIPVLYDWNTNDEIAQDVVDGWMDSPGHRENILESNYDKEGIGIVISESDEVYVTQNFC